VEFKSLDRRTAIRLAGEAEGGEVVFEGNDGAGEGASRFFERRYLRAGAGSGLIRIRHKDAMRRLHVTSPRRTIKLNQVSARTRALSLKVTQ